MSNGVGWGVGGDVAQPVAPRRGALSTGDALESMAEDLDALRNRHVLPQVYQPLTFSLATDESKKADLGSMVILSSFIVSIISGTVNFWFGDYVGNESSIPHMQFSAGEKQQFVLPPRDYVFTVQATGGAATLTLIPMAL